MHLSFLRLALILLNQPFQMFHVVATAGTASSASLYSLLMMCLTLKVSPGLLSRKYSSCSTIFIDDNTVSQPNLKNTIKWWETLSQRPERGVTTAFFTTVETHVVRIYSLGLNEASLNTTFSTFVCFLSLFYGFQRHLSHLLPHQEQVGARCCRSSSRILLC